MSRKTKNKNVLISFVGTNDEGKRKEKPDGAILTVLKERRFDEIHLLWNTTEHGEIDFYEIARYVKSEIQKRKLCSIIKLHIFECENVTDHNEIYPKLLELCKSLKKNEHQKFTAAIASGTPTMQVCWILMAESGDFPMELVRSNEPKFGKPLVTQVEIGTGLPRILRLKEEVNALKKQKIELLPSIELSVKNPKLLIGQIQVYLSPIEFSYYRYYLERKKSDKELLRISGFEMPREFLEKIIQFHKESFPDADSNRITLERMITKKEWLTTSTFRGNVSKLNRKIRETLQNESINKYYEIYSDGKRFNKRYGIDLHEDKIIIQK